MKAHPIFWLCGMILAFCGCSRDYKVNIQLQSNEVVGDWSPSIAPQAVRQILPTNGLSEVSLILNSDGTANFNSLPFQELVDSKSMRNLRWAIVSGKGKWDLSDDGDNGRHVWHLRVVTPAIGLQLTVGKDKSGQTILAYKPDPDNDDHSVIYKLKPLKK